MNKFGVEATSDYDPPSQPPPKKIMPSLNSLEMLMNLAMNCNEKRKWPHTHTHQRAASQMQIMEWPSDCACASQKSPKSSQSRNASINASVHAVHPWDSFHSSRMNDGPFHPRGINAKTVFSNVKSLHLSLNSQSFESECQTKCLRVCTVPALHVAPFPPATTI